MLPALPNPSDLVGEAIDRDLVDCYRAFFDGLSARREGVIAADVEFFLPQDCDDQATVTKLRLLACVLRVDDALLDRLVGAALPVTRSSEAWRHCREKREASGWSMRLLRQRWPDEGGWPSDPQVAVTLLLQVEETMGTAEWSAFGPGRVAPRILLEFVHTPLSMAASDNRLACLDFDREWAIVINWADSVGFLPLIWGFVAKDDLVGNLVRLSFEMGHVPYLSGSSFELESEVDEGGRLLFALLEREEWIPPALEFLLHVNPAERARLAAVGADRLKELLSSIADLQREIDGSFDPERLLARFGRPSSENDLVRVASALRGASEPDG